MAFIRLQLRRDTAANWTSANPTLAEGEIGIETDTEQFKIGNGSDAWDDLIYAGIQGDTGPAGADGKTILSGAVDPTTEGVDGDFYINTATSTLFGPKASGTWPSGVLLIGADGADGVDGVGVPVGGTTGQALIKSSNTDYATEWGTVASSPGGSDTQVQFNDGGSFGGDAGLTFNKTSKAITLGGATVTTSSPVIDAAQTWNAVGTTFTGLKFNATDTASAAGSLLMDLQAGGTSQFNVRKDGRVTIAGPSSAASYIIGTAQFRTGSIAIGFSQNQGASFGNADVNAFYAAADSRGFVARGDLAFAFAPTNVGSNADLFLTRRAAANLRFGAADAAAPVAQTLSVQSVVAGTTNTAGANLTITGSQGTGTGAGGSIIFQVAPAGSSGTAQNALATALTIDSTRLATFANGISVQLLTGTILANFTNEFAVTSSRLRITASNSLAWSSLDNNINDGFDDLILSRDAANILAQRNGANAQTNRLYGTFTDASNYRRLALTMSTAGVAEIKPEGAGTGASGNVIHISGLPTSNPGPGILWNDGGTPAIGT